MYMLPVAVARSSSDDIAIRYVLRERLMAVQGAKSNVYNCLTAIIITTTTTLLNRFIVAIATYAYVLDGTLVLIAVVDDVISGCNDVMVRPAGVGQTSVRHAGCLRE